MPASPSPLRMCVPAPRRKPHPENGKGPRLRLAMEPGLKWANGSTLSFALHGGTMAGQAEFRRAVAIVSPLVHLNFVEILPRQSSTSPAHCRVTFNPDGQSWSDVGQDCLLVDPSEATLNLGWENDLARTIHEFLHFLGFMHNQAIPNTELHLDPAKCYEYFGGPPNDWSKEEVDDQVLYLFTGAYLGSGFDRDSLMQYAVDPSLTTDGKGIGWNQVLSAGDIYDLKTLYPIPGAPVPEKPPVFAPAAPAITTVTTPPPVAPVVVAPPLTQGPAVNPATSIETIFARLKGLLSWVPGEISKEINLAAALQSGELAILKSPFPLTVAHETSVVAQALVANAETVFPDPIFRAFAVKLLSAAYPE